MTSAEAQRRAKAWAASLTDEQLLRMAHGIRLPDEIAFIESLRIQDKIIGRPHRLQIVGLPEGARAGT